MRYQNAAELLPAELLEALQGYLDGGYLYIPRRAEHRRAWGERTRRKEETLARNRAIFRDYTAGLGRGRAVRPLFSRPKEHPADSHPGPPGPAGAIVLRRSEARSGAAFLLIVFAVASARPALLQWARKRGKIPMNQSNLLTVRVAGVMNRQAVVLHAGRTSCLLSGRLLRQKDSLAVGDRAEAEVLGGGQYRLTRVLPRTSALRRPSRRGSGDALLAANADFVLAVCAAPSLLRAFTLPERALEAARAAGLPAWALCKPLGPAGPGGGRGPGPPAGAAPGGAGRPGRGSALEPPAGLLPALRGKAVAVLGGPGCGKTALSSVWPGCRPPLRPTTAASLSQGPDGTLWLDTPGFRGASPAAKPAPDYRRQPCGESFSCKACGALVTPAGGRQPAPQPLPPLSVQPPRGRGARRPGLYLPGDYGAGGRVGAQGG